MSFKNKLRKQIIEKKAISKRTPNIAKVYAVNKDKTVDLIWRDEFTYAETFSFDIAVPDSDVGFYQGELKEGDMVHISFVNEEKNEPYIVSIMKDDDKKSYNAINGSQIPMYFNR